MLMTKSSNTTLPACGVVTHPLFGGGETGESEGQALLGGGSSSGSSSEELSSVRSITSNFLLLSCDPRFSSCESVRDESDKKQLGYSLPTDLNDVSTPTDVKSMCYLPLSTPLYEADTSCTSFFDLMGDQFPSSLNWISSQSEQLLKISMNNL